jgi:hypothetical protein
MTPAPQQTADLNGATFTVSHGPEIASPNAFITSPVNWGPSS